VADLEKGVRFYRILYGTESLRDRTTGRVWFQIGDTRLGLQQADAGQKPHIAHFGIKVAPFDAPKVAAGLQALGARVTPTPYEPGVVRLTDPDGISLEVVAPRT
jgi:catechol 2,3-dioxygenase-like lactoylglutathione lyase family enzyme